MWYSQTNISLGEDVFNTSWRRLCKYLHKISRRRLEDQYVCLSYTSWEDVFMAPSRHLDQDKYICLSHTSSTHLPDIFKSFQDVFKTFCQDVVKTYSRHLQDALTFRFIIKLKCSCWHIFRTYSRRIQHVFERYCEDNYLQKDLCRLHFCEIFGRSTKFPRVKSLDIPKLLKQFF